MTKFHARKTAIRSRMALTGEKYTVASRRLDMHNAALAAPSLFQDELRTDRAAKLYNEPAFAFLERSADPHIAEVRALMETWLSHVPIMDRADLRGRLVTKDDAQFEAAFWELYLHEAYLRSGYTVTIHPHLKHSRRHPDFLVEGHGTRFYLETVRACAPKNEGSRNKRLEDLRQLLASLAAGRFRIDMTTYARGERPPSMAKIKKALREWLANVDTGTEAEHRAAAGRYEAVSHFTWRQGGWHLKFSAVPLDPACVWEGQCLVGIHVSGGWSRDSERITAALGSKTDTYGQLDAPLVIAVLSNSEFGTEDHEFEIALYGALIGHRPATEMTPSALHTPGHWYSDTGWQHGHAPQVIAAMNLFPWSVTRVQPRLWSTLEPEIPALAQPAWLAQVKVTGPAPQLDSAESMGSLFGSPDPWPSSPLELLPTMATAVP